MCVKLGEATFPGRECEPSTSTYTCTFRFGPSQLSCLGSSVGRALCLECRGFESHPRQLIFSRKSDCLGCAVLLCLVCLFDLACFFLSSFSYI